MEDLSNQIQKTQPTEKEQLEKIKDLIEAPAGEIKQEQPEPAPVESDVWSEIKPLIRVRKFDSIDIMRIRNAVSMDEKNSLNLNLGTMQRISIVLGLSVAPFFSDQIGMDGIDENVFDKRFNKEFRRIPADILDNLVMEIEKVNKSQFGLKTRKN